MKQYYALKKQHPDAMLLFRVGDFYETFGEDAVYDQYDSQGFINLFGLPIKVKALLDQKKLK